MATRIGVDIGGTFTDLVFFDEDTGQTREGKLPTVPSAPEQGVLNAVREFVPPQIIAKADYFLHGTTVGLNALLERRGAKVGMVCTKGFRDVLEIRRGDRAEMYNLFWQQPEPLVPRYLRLELDERILFDGTVHRPLDEAAVVSLVKQFNAEGVDSLAICFMNAYANPAHELRAAELLREHGFTGDISMSHKVSREYREYERFSTTAIDAFVRTRMSSYLQRLEEGLVGMGFNGRCLIARSGSGSMTFAEAGERPFETIMSGPVGGAQGGSEIARSLDIDALITADVGGTSFDTALILDGQAQVLFEGEVAGMPVQSAWVDVRSIGSGGGSVAYKDIGGLLRVGPRSSGAVPGPACYGKGGTEPTTTDAAAHLGMLGPGKLASGIQLDFAASEKAIGDVAQQIGKNVLDTAVGIMRIATSSMANAMREITVEQGLDPRSMALLPFGGAGPMFAILLADELQISKIIVPPLAGNFSAWGLLGADMVQSAALTRIMPLNEESLGETDKVLAELFSELDARGEISDPALERLANLDLRYVGQEHGPSIPVPLAGSKLAASSAEIRSLFEEDYLRTYGSTMEFDVEIVAIRATNRIPLPRREHAAPSVQAGAQSTWPAYSFSRGEYIDFDVIDRSSIGDEISGPVIITESTTTLYVDADWSVRAGSKGELVLTRGAAKK